jgi:AAA domain, putative AbiEii toxin, Type IV TA system/Overcoming lysogenization defect protein-like, TOPRIM domain
MPWNGLAHHSVERCRHYGVDRCRPPCRGLISFTMPWCAQSAASDVPTDALTAKSGADMALALVADMGKDMGADQSIESPEGEWEPARPKIVFETITFSDGKVLELEDDDIVVFVGPNNAGKSAALRELEGSIGRPAVHNVVSACSLRFDGTPETLGRWLEKNAMQIGPPGAHEFRGMGYGIHVSHLGFFQKGGPNTHIVAPLFASRVGTDSRLTGSNPAGPIKLHFEPPTNPIHLLLMDEGLSSKLSGYFAQAFGTDLILFRAGGSEFPLLVGARPSLSAGQDELGKGFVEHLLRTTKPLAEQGDGMRSFATVLLHVIAADNYSVQFLDEPEAFLHPPQARLLGRLIASNRRSKSQLFVATHSPEVLEGVLSADSSKVRIVRIQRDGDINRTKELSKQRTANVATDPLTRFSRVISGIFHKRVIIAESESDCLFYNAILNSNAVSGLQTPDVLFIHAGGKDRMKELAALLKELDVPVSVIADIDILNDEAKFRALFEALGGEWPLVADDWKALNNSVLAARPPLSAGQVRLKIEAELSAVDGNKLFPKEVERNIKSVFQSVSPWQQVKKMGRVGFERGAPLMIFDRLFSRCGQVGLWIVPVGELEGFCRTVIARHGPGFTEAVLMQRDIEADPELKEARDFIKKVWGTGS